jgi:hypothetical protein
MSDYRIEAATKEEWANRALNAEERNKELTLQLLATSGQAADALDKLAKAVECLRWYADFGNYLSGRKEYALIDLDKGGKAEDVLAELEK